MVVISFHHRQFTGLSSELCFDWSLAGQAKLKGGRRSCNILLLAILSYSSFLAISGHWFLSSHTAKKSFVKNQEGQEAIRNYNNGPSRSILQRSPHPPLVWFLHITKKPFVKNPKGQEAITSRMNQYRPILNFLSFLAIFAQILFTEDIGKSMMAWGHHMVHKWEQNTYNLSNVILANEKWTSFHQYLRYCH